MKDLTVLEVLNFLWDHILSITVILGVFFEISKIQINPISWLANLFYKPLRKDMADMENRINQNMDNMKTELKSDINALKDAQLVQEKKIEDLIKVQETNEISRIRWEILEFSRSLVNKQLHTRDEYLHIKDDNKKYHELIDKYELTNGIIDEEMEKINEHYEDHKESTSVYF